MDLIVQQIRFAAEKFGWIKIDHQENINMISFMKEGDRINVYYSKPNKLTVTSVIIHPIKGRGQLFRRNISTKELERIFRYPRIHTGKGYFTK